LYKRTELYRRLKISRNTAQSMAFSLGDLMRSKTWFFSDFDSSDGILAEHRAGL